MPSQRKYNPSADIVAGRSAAEIERAKSRAVGGKRRRCVKGKSCGSSCISARNLCLVDIPWVMVGEIQKARKEIQRVTPPVVPKPPTLTEQEISNITMLAKYHANAYGELAKKKKQTDEIKEKLQYHSSKIEQEISKLPEGEAKAKLRAFVDSKLGKPNLDNDRKDVEMGIKDASFWYKMGQPAKGEDSENKTKLAIGKLPEGEREAALKKLADSVKEAKEIKAASDDAEQKLKNRTPREVIKSIGKHVRTMEENYAKLAELQKQSLPSGEEWQLTQARDNAKIAFERALLELKYLPVNMRAKATDTINARAIAAQNPSMTTKEREKVISNLLTKYLYSIAAGSSTDAERAALKAQIRSLAEGFSGNKKAQIMAKIDRALGELKPLDLGKRVESPQELAKLGKDTLDKYAKLKSTKRVLDRYDRIKKEIGDRITAIDTTAEQRERLSRQMAQADYIKNRAHMKMLKAMSELRADLLKTNLTEGQIKEVMNRVNFVKGKGIVQVRKDVEEYLRMFNGRGFTDITGVNGKPLYKVEITKDRASAKVTMGSITTNGNKETTFHEITHLLETQRPEMLQYAISWRASKAFDGFQAKNSGVTAPIVEVKGTKPVYRLQDLEGPGYRKEEVAYADSYLHPYMGKVYSGANSFSTEVWTMALQHFSTVGGMVTLYRAHPELFEIGVGMAKS